MNKYKLERLDENTIIVHIHNKRKITNNSTRNQRNISYSYNYIYVLQNKSDLDELFVTYNIDTAFKPDKPLGDTILVHRKKQSNTLYTINALNELVKEENNGVLDKSFAIDWE